MKSPVIKRSIVIAGHKTSVSLEDAFWKGLKDIAVGRHTTLSDLVASIDTDAGTATCRRPSGCSCSITIGRTPTAMAKAATASAATPPNDAMVAPIAAVPSVLRPE